MNEQQPLQGEQEQLMRNNQSTKEPVPKLAKTSLVFGFLSFIPLIGTLFGVIAIVLGIYSLIKTKVRTEVLYGFTVFAILLGIGGIALTEFYAVRIIPILYFFTISY